MEQKSKELNVLFVTSRSLSMLKEDGNENGDLYYFDFFQLNSGKINILSTVDELATYMGTSFENLKFLGRLIPKTDKNKNVVEETQPTRKNIDGIITDLFLRRGEFSKDMDIFGLGIVAWAVKYGIPVGLIARDYIEHPQYSWLNKNPYYYSRNDDLFWIDSVLDTLRTDSRLKNSKIPVGGAREVCVEMREILLKK